MNANRHQRGPPIPKIPPWLLDALHITAQCVAILIAGALLGVLVRSGGGPAILYENIPPAAVAVAFLNTLRLSLPSHFTP